MPDEFAVNDPYYRYDPLSYGKLYNALMCGVGQTAQTAQSPHYEQWGSILEVADAWGSVSEYLNNLADSMMAWLLRLRETWGGQAAEQHEWRMSNLMTWMSSMAREAAAMRTGLMLMSNHLDEAQTEGFQVPCPPPKKSGGFLGDVLAVGSAVLTLGASQLIPAKAFGASMTQPGSERRSPEMARLVANLAMDYLLTERKYWNGPLLNPLSLDPREQPMIDITPPQTGGGDGSQPGGDGSQPGGDGFQPGGGSGYQPGGDGSLPGGDGYQSGGDGGTGTASGRAAAGALGSGTSSFGSGPPSWPQPASAPMVGAVPGVLGAERLVVPTGSGGPGAGGAGPVAPPMMGMMGAGAPAAGNSPDKSGRPTRFWREDEIEWSRDEHAQWVDPDEKPPPALDTRRG